MDYSFWDILEIRKLERSLKYRMAAKALELASKHMPYGKSLSRKFRNETRELLELHQIHLAVKEASECAKSICDEWNSEKDNLKNEKLQSLCEQIGRRLKDFFQSLKIDVDEFLFADTMCEILENSIQTSDDEIIGQAMKSRKK